MITFILALLSSNIISYVLGLRRRGQKKFSEQTAVQVIENLKAMLKLQDTAHEEKIKFLSQRYIELKNDIGKCFEANRLLKEEINQLKGKSP